jgi:hypothetical protein
MESAMRTWILLLGLTASIAGFADRLGTEGATQTFDADFEKVWNAALVALDDKTIETANKEIGQITTKAEKGHSFLAGDTSKSISVKIGRAKPCKVVIHANVERTTQVSVGGATRSGTDTYSDDDLEKEVLKAMEKQLSIKEEKKKH